jgi:hypothetical protein
MATAYVCDYCKSFTLDIYRVKTIAIRSPDGDLHEITVVLNYSSEQRQGEYCLQCVPKIMGKAIQLLNQEACKDGSYTPRG